MRPWLFASFPPPVSLRAPNGDPLGLAHRSCLTLAILALRAMLLAACGSGHLPAFHTDHRGVVCHAPCGRGPLPPLRASAMSLQRPSPLASFPPPVSPAAPRDRRPADRLGIAALGIGDTPRGIGDPQGLTHRSCFQQRFPGRLHSFKQLTCTVLVTHV